MLFTKWKMDTVWRRLVLSVCIFFSSSLFSQEIDEILFGGTMLAYTAKNVPPGHFAFEQFFLFSKTYGEYDKNSKLRNVNYFRRFETLPYLKFGIFDFLDFNILANLVEHEGSFAFGDTLALFGLQVMRASKGGWAPDVRFLVGESFPTGDHDGLDATLHDETGSGAFETTFILSVAKIFPISKRHALRFNPNLYYIIPNSLHISGFSIYGGNVDNRGIVQPGPQIAFDFPCEYNITNHLIVGIDSFYIHRDRSSFRSTRIEKSFAGLPSSENFSIAPCLEYTVSRKFGLTGGIWFSVKGRNSLAFSTGVLLGWLYF